MNKPKNLMRFMRLFGVPVNSMSYIELLREVSVVFTQAELSKHKKIYENTIKAL